MMTFQVDTWQRAKLAEICDRITDGTHQPPSFTSEGIPFLFVRNIVSGQIDFNVEKYVSQETYEELTRRHRPLPGDLLFSAVGSFGVAVVVDTERPFTFQRHIALIKPKRNQIDSYFLALYLNSLEGRQQSEIAATGGSQRTVTLQALAEFVIPLPPLAEQKRIAAIAQKADRLRRTRRYALQLSDTYLQSVFLEMFGDPVTNPKGWETGTLGDVIISAKDGPHVSPTYSDSGIPFLSTRNIRKGQIVWEDLKFISPEDVKEHWKKCKPERGDILYTKGGTTGLAKAVDFDTQIAVWVHIAVLKLKHERVNPAWLENMLNSDFCYKQSQELTFGIVNRDLGLQRMPRIKIYIPPLPLQEKFAQIVQKFERLRTQQREGDRQAEHLFQTLLYRAFRGELTPQDTNDEPASVLLEEIGAEQAQAEAEAKAATQAMGDAAEYLGTKAEQQDTEPIQLKLPGIE
jgi:type I restriction enzyme S subunit